MSTSSVIPVAPSVSTISWTEGGETRSALWHSERGSAPPKRVVLADDTLSADSAYRLACEGTGLLWRGDFQNARLLVQAMARRTDKPAKVKAKKTKDNKTKDASPQPEAALPMTAEAFHLHRQAQAQRARVLGMVLIPFDADYTIPLRRAPDAKKACTQAWGAANAESVASVASLRELMGFISAHEWRKRGVEIAELGKLPMFMHNRIHPHYGVFSPVRGEYIALVKEALTQKLQQKPIALAFDIGTGTGVLAAVLARGGVEHVVATDQDPRALVCARDNLLRLDLTSQIKLAEVDLFPEGQAPLIVCNPPWLPARPGSPLEHAIYDEGSSMLLGFLNGLAAHLSPGGEGWLILSDLAEHLGLRTRAELLAAIESAGLKVLGRMDAQPQHPKASDASDALHAARAAEVTSLWRLGAK
jgi:methylase of polypeptide subunit release factors